MGIGTLKKRNLYLFRFNSFLGAMLVIIKELQQIEL